MMATKSKSKIPYKKLFLALVILVLVALLGFYFLLRDEDQSDTSASSVGLIEKIVNATPLSGISSVGQDVIIVHGYSGKELGNQSTWDEVYGTLKSQFEADGYIVHAPLLPTDDPTVNAEFICKYMEDNNLTNVALVGHSMGGLSARYCIKNLNGLPRVSFYGSIDSPQYGFSGASCAFTPTKDLCTNSKFMRDLNEGDDIVQGPYWLDMTIEWPALVGACHMDIPGESGTKNHRAAPARQDVYQWIKQGIETKDVCENPGAVLTPTSAPTPSIGPGRRILKRLLEFR